MRREQVSFYVKILIGWTVFSCVGLTFSAAVGTPRDDLIFFAVLSLFPYVLGGLSMLMLIFGERSGLFEWQRNLYRSIWDGLVDMYDTIVSSDAAGCVFVLVLALLVGACAYLLVFSFSSG